MGRGHGSGDGGVLGRDVGVVERRLGVDDLPLAADLLDVDRHPGHAHAPVVGLGEQDLLAGRGVRDVALRDLEVRVADEHGVDAGDLLGEERARVLDVGQRVAPRRLAVVAGVARDDDDVGAGGLEAGHHDLRLLDDAGELHLALDVGLVPDRDAGGHETEDADLDRLGVGQATVLMTHGLKTGAPVFQSTELAESRGKSSLLLERPQRVEAVVVLVVAEGGGVVADLVHRRGHRVRRAAGDGVDLGVVVGQRRALDRVAGVDRQGALATDLGPDRLDDRGGLGHADVVGLGVGVLGVLEVVPVVDVAVQVGRAEHGQTDDLAVGAGAGRSGSGVGGRGRAHAREARATDGGEGQQAATGGGGSEEVRVGSVLMSSFAVRCSIGAVPVHGARLAPEAQGTTIAGHVRRQADSTGRFREPSASTDEPEPDLVDPLGDLLGRGGRQVGSAADAPEVHVDVGVRQALLAGVRRDEPC